MEKKNITMKPQDVKMEPCDVKMEQGSSKLDEQGDVKMEPAENQSESTKPPGKSTVMIMPTGPAPIISNKHPVMHLNELASDCNYELVSEDKETDPKNKKRRVYTMLLTVNGEKFQGVGQSKKVAREEAAKYALLKLFKYLYIPEASMKSFVPEGTVLGKRPGEVAAQPVAGQTESKKKKKKEAANLEPKNPVMRLNELRSGLEYVLESSTGPVHAPVFVMSLVVDGMKYEGCGSSKKKAKLDVATKALNVVEPQSVEQINKCEPSTTT